MSMQNWRRIGMTLSILLLCGGMMAETAAASARSELETQVYPTTIQPGETVSLRLRLRGSLLRAEPDFTPLEHDFQIEDIGQTQRQVIANGSRDESAEWLVEIRPLRTGAVEVPTLTVGSAHTTPQSILVDATGPAMHSTTPSTREATEESIGGEPLFVTVDVDRAHPYEQERTVLRVRVYASAQITEGTLGDPQIEEGASVTRIGEDRSFEKDIGGRHYVGVERSYAVTPMQAGPLHVAPVTFEAVVPARSTRSRAARFGFHDDFFSGLGLGDDLFDRLLGSRGQRIAVRSEPLTLDVRPRPAESQGHWWLPAHDLAIEESWSANPASVDVGEVLTRRISLRAEGASAAALPPLVLPEVDGAKQYAEAANNEDNPSGSVRIQDTTLIPTKAGPLTLPAVDIHWWDVKTDTPRVAQLPARTIEVRGGGAPAMSMTAPRPGSPDPVVAEAGAAPQPQPAGEAQTASEWRSTRLIALASLFLLLAIAWIVRRRLAHRLDRFRAERKLSGACRRGNPASADRALRSLRECEGHASDQHRAESDKHYAKALADLAEVRYSRHSESWDGRSFWAAYRASRKRARKAASGESRNLPPLYPRRHRLQQL